MKKLLVSICLCSLFIGSLFAEPGDFFGHRLFELKVDVPVDVSNNAIGFDEIFVKDIVFDFADFCDNLPKKGFDFSAQTTPSVSMKLDFKKGLIVGVSGGVDMYSNIGVSKDLFKFLGYGNELNENISVSIDGYADLFAYAQVDAGWHFNRLSITAQPAIFGTLVHGVSNGSSVSVSNTADGRFGIDVDGKFDVYTQMTSAEIENKSITNVNTLLNLITPTTGFDLSGTAEYKLFDFLTLKGSARIPIVPSSLTNKYEVQYSTSYSFSLDDLSSKGEEEGEDSNPDDDDDSGSTTGFGSLFDDPIYVDYKINRPMKLSVTADFHPFGNFINYCGGIGIGFKHPFSVIPEERGVYLDYLLSARFSLFNVLSVTVSTERTDEIYKHKALLAMNFRFIELDAGLALESASLVNSFKGNGIGAFVTAYIGF